MRPAEMELPKRLAAGKQELRRGLAMTIGAR